jgi:hypothetical protein
LFSGFCCAVIALTGIDEIHGILWSLSIVNSGASTGWTVLQLDPPGHAGIPSSLGIRTAGDLA